MEEILIEDYNYPLPDERIAKYPLAKRDTSKLLVYRDGQVSEDVFAHVGEYLSSDSLLVYNNTRVIQARLEFHKKSLGVLISPEGSNEYSQANGQKFRSSYLA
jgi:S-adenosylmethionine:tRNA ribosyltransferase-isomerase